MPSYRAREPIYLNNESRLVEAGEVFASDEVPGHAWIALDCDDAALTAATPRKPGATAE